MSRTGRARLYTRGGATGETGLLGPRRGRKDHPRVDAYGAVDELNAHLGWARAECAAVPVLAGLVPVLQRIQRRLLDVGAELAVDPQQPAPPAVPMVGAADIAWLEAQIDVHDERLPALRTFVLPGGGRAGAALHTARTVARRAERRVVALSAVEPVRPEVLAFLNRLSDLLFVLARWANHVQGIGDIPWSPGWGDAAPSRPRQE
ncbi:MAG: cob(I)yrinic acid a,c-diamide adenosyltransferase [Firmicutes bacterium]|nr:cob(I)yrinic acid a,c-diamide adenosyltransferase [Bacillota bacterium]